MKKNQQKTTRSFWTLFVAGMLLVGSVNAQESWKLDLKQHPGLTIEEVEKLLKPVYDTVDLRYDPGSDLMSDTMVLTYEPLYFFEVSGISYALQVIENQGPFFGVSVGWCDLALLRKDRDSWKLADVLLQAGGGGMYGSSGQFKGMLKVGKNAGGIVLSGGQTHMGELFHDDIILLQNERLSQLVGIYTHHSYGDWDESADGYKVCEDNEYQFLESDRERYDLRIIRSNCLDKQEKETERVIIPYNKGYKIPKGFIFEG